MKSLTNKCHKCMLFIRYYYVNDAKFSFTQRGFCRKHNKDVKSNGSCEEFTHLIKKDSSNLRYAQLRLDELIMEISALRVWLEEQVNEQEEL